MDFVDYRKLGTNTKSCITNEYKCPFFAVEKDNIKQALTLDTFTIGISFLIIYLTFDVIIKNYLLINNTFPLLRDFALMLSGLIFIFSLCVPFIKKKGEEG